MLILINDNNIFINGIECNVFNTGIVMGILEHILVKNYCIPTMCIGGYLNGMEIKPITCGHLFQAGGHLSVVLNAEINKVLTLLQQNASQSNILYITILNGRIAMTNQTNNGGIQYGSGGIFSAAT